MRNKGRTSYATQQRSEFTAPHVEIKMETGGRNLASFARSGRSSEDNRVAFREERRSTLAGWRRWGPARRRSFLRKRVYMRALHHNWITRSIVAGAARARLKRSNLPLRRHSTQYVAATPLAITSLTSNIYQPATFNWFNRSSRCPPSSAACDAERKRLPAPNGQRRMDGALRDRTAILDRGIRNRCGKSAEAVDDVEPGGVVLSDPLLRRG